MGGTKKHTVTIFGDDNVEKKNNNEQVIVVR